MSEEETAVERSDMLVALVERLKQCEAARERRIDTGSEIIQTFVETMKTRMEEIKLANPSWTNERAFAEASRASLKAQCVGDMAIAREYVSIFDQMVAILTRCVDLDGTPVHRLLEFERRAAVARMRVAQLERGQAEVIDGVKHIIESSQ